MKKLTKRLALVFLIGSTFSYAAPETALAKDFLKMTRDDLPPVQILIKAALDNSKIVKTSLSEMKRSARRSAVLPVVRLDVDYDMDAANRNQFTEVSQFFPESNRTIGGWNRVGFENRTTYGIYAEWDLANFIWERTDAQVADRYSRQGGLVRRRTIEVSQRYSKLKILLPAEPGEPIEDSDIAEILEHAIYLDAISGNALSARILEKSK